jgi:hypothetical protein
MKELTYIIVLLGVLLAVAPSPTRADWVGLDGHWETVWVEIVLG